MKTIAKLTIAALFAAALTGCNAAPAPTMAMGEAVGQAALTAVAAEARGIDAVGKVSIIDPAGYRLQALTAWNKTDVAKVILRLHKDTGAGYADTGLSKTVTDLSAAVTLTNLKMATGYKIVAEAYDASNARIDNQAETGSEADCRVTFTTPSLVAATAGDNVNDATITLSIPVKLKNKTFAGQASSASGVGVTNGTIVNTTATEAF